MKIQAFRRRYCCELASSLLSSIRKYFIYITIFYSFSSRSISSTLSYPISNHYLPRKSKNNTCDNANSTFFFEFPFQIVDVLVVAYEKRLKSQIFKILYLNFGPDGA